MENSKNLTQEELLEIEGGLSSWFINFPIPPLSGLIYVPIYPETVVEKPIIRIS